MLEQERVVRNWRGHSESRALLVKILSQRTTAEFFEQGRSENLEFTIAVQLSTGLKDYCTVLTPLLVLATARIFLLLVVRTVPSERDSWRELRVAVSLDASTLLVSLGEDKVKNVADSFIQWFDSIRFIRSFIHPKRRKRHSHSSSHPFIFPFSPGSHHPSTSWKKESY